MKEEDMQRQCRRRRERIDSVTPLIIAERLAYQERIGHVAVDKAYVDRLVKEGFGKKRKLPTLYAQVPGTDPMKLTGTAAGGVAQFMAAASKNWPVFEHMLPEIAFAGHSNCGKSTLVNAMIGISPRKGVASVSDRAGWTDQVCFYKLGKRPPVMTLVDLPGYGHAVASDQDKREWKEMTRAYLGARPILARCCLLIDCTRGVCEEDRIMLRFLSKVGTPWQVLLTKGDLLTVEELAQSVLVVAEDTAEYVGGLGVSPVSSSTGAGVQRLWRDLLACVDAVAKPAPPGSVREHFKAAVVKGAAHLTKR